MDWSYAIERNRDALKSVLAALVAMAGFAAEGLPFSPLAGRRWPEGSDEGRRPTLPRHLHRAVLRLLRPAESAARRLVIIAARGLVVPPARPRVRKPKPAPTSFRQGAVTGIWMPPGFSHPPSARPGAPERPSKRRKPCLPLFDRLPRLGARRPAPRGIPRICLPGMGTSAPSERPSKGRPPLTPDDALDASRLQGRLLALAWALDDLAGQARRYARWRMRAAAVGETAQVARPAPARRLWPLKPGRPPGFSRGPVHAVHEILRDAHALALRVLDSLDTS